MPGCGGDAEENQAHDQKSIHPCCHNFLHT
jgi:hypothetical protein